MTPSPHSDQLIWSALPIDGTFRRTYESSPLSSYKRGTESKPLESKSTLDGPPPQFSSQPYSREEGTPPLWSGCHQFWIQMQGCQMRSAKENIRGRQRTAHWELQHRRLWLAKGAEVCWPQPSGDASGCHLIPAAAAIVLHRHWRCCTRPMLQEQRRGPNVGTTRAVIG